GEQVEFSFDQIRIYTITLVTTFGNGSTGITFFDIEIGDIGIKKFLIPTAKITPPGKIVVGTEIIFSGAASIPTTVNQYYWDFGDNTPDPSPNATSQIKHTFTTIGKHTVTLAVQDLDTNGGFTGIDVIEVDVVDSATGGGGPAAVTGLSLYESNCLSCHGIAGAGLTAKNIKGATEVLIDTTLINGVHPAVSVTPAAATNTQLIASYLGSGAVATDGLSLYTTKCLICHGADGVGVPGLGKRVDGVAVTIIERAINNQKVNAIPPPITYMKGIQLTTAEASLVSAYLATVVPVANALSGQAKFINNCQMCHGTAEGGQAIVITTATEAQITTAILNIPSMNSRLASLSLFDKNEIELYLLGPTYIPRPTTGAALFEMYCSYCHGATGQGGIGNIAQNSINGKRIDEKRIRDAYGENGISIMRKGNLPNVNFTKTERQSMAIFLDPTVANGGK
ncbi:MAG: c-type cytochrome, partial [Gammaproteobacteria bacterium]